MLERVVVVVVAELGHVVVPLEVLFLELAMLEEIHDIDLDKGVSLNVPVLLEGLVVVELVVAEVEEQEGEYVEHEYVLVGFGQDGNVVFDLEIMVDVVVCIDHEVYHKQVDH